MMKTSGYRLIELLHTGRYVCIYRALDLSRECPVIVKAPLTRESEADAIRSFEQETELAEQIGHHFTLPFRLISSEIPGMMAAGPVEGTTLRMAMRGSPVELGVFFEVAVPLANLIDRLHRSGHIHHNIHPELVYMDTGTGSLRFLDFSYATTMDKPGDFVLAGHQMESLLPYISPEQTGRLAVPLDYRTDLYSFGVIMYELLTGKLPVTAEKPEEWVHGHLTRTIIDPRKLREDIPEPLGGLVMKCLAKHADDRYQSACGLKEDLLRCQVQWEASAEDPSFLCMRNDVPLHFRLPQQQYGREEILSSIASSLREGTVIFISGDPGIGKTSLLEEIHRLSSRQKGCCLWGKFEQYKQDIPYQPFIEVFRQFVIDILGRDSYEIERWKTILLKALGRSASLITEFIPQMAHIIGQQPKAEAVPPAEAQQRFHLTLNRFIEALLEHARPLTLMMDDLQWAGPESLAMLERIAELGEKYKPIVIGAYRSHDQGQIQPLQGSIASIRKGRLPVREYALHPLGPGDTCTLVSDVLHVSPSACGELSERIYRISGGTPQFIKELLSALHKEKCIHFNIKEWEWQWDMALIETFRVSEDIMELLDRSIQQLSPKCVDMLGMAACIGTVFDGGLLAGVGQIPVPELTGLLSEAAAAGIIALQQDNGYVFVHDRILQVVREGLPAGRLQHMHYRIGIYLLEQLSEEERQEQLYDLVNHLNAGLACLPAAKRRLLAELNLGAGRKAKSSNAFHTGLTFLRFGVELLAGDPWKSDYDLAFALHREWLECEYLCGNYEPTKQLFDSVIEHVRAPIERAGMYVILALNYRRYDRSIEAIDAGMKGLEELAIRFPTVPSQPRLIWESTAAWLSLRKVRLEDIPGLPAAQDENVRIAAQLMAIISPCAYLTSPELLAMIGFRLTRLSLQYGSHHHAAEGYIIYAMVTGLHFGNFDAGMRIGQAGLKVSEQHGSLASRITANFAFGAFFGHWMKPLREIESYLLHSIDLCMRTGDWTYTTYSVHYYLSTLLYRGETLPKFALAIAEYEHKARSMKEPMFHLTLRLYGQFQLALRGETRSPFVWDDDTFSEISFLQEIHNSGMAEIKQFDYDLLKM